MSSLITSTLSFSPLLSSKIDRNEMFISYVAEHFKVIRLNQLFIIHYYKKISKKYNLKINEYNLQKLL